MAASKRKRRKGLKADYKDATPEQVAKAVLMYRPPKGGSGPVVALDSLAVAAELADPAGTGHGQATGDLVGAAVV